MINLARFFPEKIYCYTLELVVEENFPQQNLLDIFTCKLTYLPEKQPEKAYH